MNTKRYTYPQVGRTYLYSADCRYPGATVRILENLGDGYMRVMVRPCVGTTLTGHFDSHSAIVWFTDIGECVG